MTRAHMMKLTVSCAPRITFTTPGSLPPSDEGSYSRLKNYCGGLSEHHVRAPIRAVRAPTRAGFIWCRIAGPLSSEYGTHTTVKARLWPYRVPRGSRSPPRAACQRAAATYGLMQPKNDETCFLTSCAGEAWLFSYHRMHSLISLRKSTPPQNRQLVVYYD